MNFIQILSYLIATCDSCEALTKSLITYLEIDVWTKEKSIKDKERFLQCRNILEKCFRTQYLRKTIQEKNFGNIFSNIIS